MARTGAGEVSEFSPDGALVAMAFGAIVLTLCIAGNASAHGGRLNAEGCHRDRKHGGYHCHRGGSSSLHRNSIPSNGFAPARIAPARALRGAGMFANCAEARAAGAAPVRRGEPGYGPHLDRDGDGVGCELRRR
jgi:Excalibur calcium-binding domain